MSSLWWEVVWRSVRKPAELKGANDLWESGTIEAVVILEARQWTWLSSHLWPVVHLAPTILTQMNHVDNVFFQAVAVESNSWACLSYNRILSVFYNHTLVSIFQMDFPRFQALCFYGLSLCGCLFKMIMQKRNTQQGQQCREVLTLVNDWSKPIYIGVSKLDRFNLALWWNVLQLMLSMNLIMFL